jgi:uncharacterized protein (DUF342 family)
MTRDELYIGTLVFDDKARLKLSADGMEAVLSPVSGQLDLQYVHLIPQLLEDAGIVHGLLGSPQTFGSGVVLAAGTRPVDGDDAKIVLAVDVNPGPGDRGTGGENMADDKSLYADPRRLGIVVNVREGQVLARKTPPTEGLPGKNVFGELVAQKPGGWVDFVFGDGAAVSPDNESELVALRDGKVELRDCNQLCVLDEWVLDGSVDASTGHVEFWGRSLVVNGSVMGGFEVNVEGDLGIKGNIEDGAKVCVGGNLEVGGITRAEKTEVEVSGDLTCAQIEYARITVKGDLKVKDYILDAVCTVRGSASVTDGKGLIAGGEMFVGRNLVANVLGTQANVPTRICAGYDPLLRGKFEKLAKEMKTLGQKLADIEGGLKRVKTIEARGSLDEKKAEIKKRLVDSSSAMIQEMLAYREELSVLEAHRKSVRLSTIEAVQFVYANTILAIDDAVFESNMDVKNTKFVFEKGRIVSKSC